MSVPTHNGTFNHNEEGEVELINSQNNPFLMSNNGMEPPFPFQFSPPALNNYSMPMSPTDPKVLAAKTGGFTPLLLDFPYANPLNSYQPLFSPEFVNYSTPDFPNVTKPHAGSLSPNFSDTAKPATPPAPNSSMSSFPGLYSNSGFDMIGILAKVATRSNAQINIGSVDMSCAFLVVDARRFDFPIVYASASFEKLSGYSGPEIIGRNCRFLQSPDGQVTLGSRRKFTDNSAVHHIKSTMIQGKESQNSLVNYKKNGQPFINLITVIPIAYDGDEITHFVGFQIDLVEQPNSILERMKDGTYVVNYNLLNIPPLVSTELYHHPFEDFFQPSNAKASGPIPLEVFDLVGLEASTDEQITNRLWNRMLLEHSEDVIHVLSLKGVFLYCSPSCKKVLEYDPDELVGQSISAVCEPSDLVPVMRELKESTSNGSNTVSLVYRVKRKNSGYIWFEAQGRLHSDQGKGRKCIVLVGRSRPVYRLSWEALQLSGGLSDNEFWAKLSLDGMYLYVTSECQNLLGSTPDELTGTSLYQLVRSDRTTALTKALHQARDGTTTKLKHTIQNKKGQYVEVLSVFYPGDACKNGKSSFILCQSKELSADDTSSEHSSHSSNLPLPQTDHVATEADNMFDMLDLSRNTTWQYELHQLRLVNKKLKEELEALTASRKKKKRKTSPNSGKVCSQCQRKDSPQWHKDGSRNLCDTCSPEPSDSSSMLTLSSPPSQITAL
ncbi:hypothetical protein K493DRAFT_311836 [Basidiobolus meristosporus CBS 931.73]|uniref:PAS domain-containing protein n=1 Tax=Basidiobolus meristosporus CBS 931.73 TaxID=1314790 RepID=A0A1Y1YYI9_9FUNG|nr:hypothetical protein K493DRAFT_311836 [Basidiobolus meristosporus CBS 931.73]|eukprot:ORY03092.1 hypothetical protein K493DRAFT_311836 [Basidiobolus meristosporus CBS 931.73]